MKIDFKYEKEKNRKKKINSRTMKGITLIALIITIIVLLILAGVSIAMLTGQNGILGQTNTAKIENRGASVQEVRDLWKANKTIDVKTGNSTAKSLNEVLTEVKDKNLLTDEEITTINETGKITIGSRIIVFDIREDFIDEKGNEWVWIKVPKSVTEGKNTDVEIETALQGYVTDYRKEDWTDALYEGCGLLESEYNNLKSKMLQSIKSNGGFHIGKYEVGTDTQRTSASDALTTPIIKQDKYVYNRVTCSQAQSLASQLSTDGKTTSLIFGIQWDLVLKYIEEKGAKTQAELKTDSTTWGNYYNSTFNITRGKYSTDYGANYTDITGTHTKATSSYVLLTTGASERNKTLNIYDLAGNAYEWTLEKSSNSSEPCAYRGGDYYRSGNSTPATNRNDNSPSFTYDSIAFRTALY